MRKNVACFKRMDQKSQNINKKVKMDQKCQSINKKEWLDMIKNI